MIKVKRMLAALLSVIMVAALVTGCTGSGGKGTETTKGTSANTQTSTTQKGTETAPTTTTKPVSYRKELVVALASDTTTLDPNQTNQAQYSIVKKLSHSTLLNPYDTTKTDLVEKWERVTPTLYKFTLREGIKFHDGSPCTAQDVLFTYNRAKSIGSSYRQSELDMIEDVKLIDDLTFTVETKTVSADFIGTFGGLLFTIFSEEAFATLPEEKALMIGTGPYVMQEWVQGDHYIFTRFEDYYGEKPKTERIKVVIITEASARGIALQNDEVQIIQNPSVNDMTQLEEDKNVRVELFDGSRIYYLALNITRPPLDNPKVRQAIAYAINKDDINEVAMGRYGNPVRNIVPNTTWGFVDIPGIPLDPAKGKQLLAEAGYPNGFEMDLMTTSGRAAIATLIMEDLAEIGIKLNLRLLETSAQTAARKERDYDSTIQSWGANEYPDSVFRNLFRSNGGNNDPQIKEKYVDDLTDAALDELDETKRLAMYKELQEYIVNGAYVVPLYQEKVRLAVSAKLEGPLQTTATGNFYFAYCYITE